ncbi:hypothetical protein LEMLEM_LOCUS10683 [Lemmus lemmus]
MTTTAPGSTTAWVRTTGNTSCSSLCTLGLSQSTCFSCWASLSCAAPPGASGMPAALCRHLAPSSSSS